MLAIVCPGQGSQSPGFLTPWLELPGVDDRLSEYSAAAGMDLRAHGTVSDAETIRDTAVAQPLIVSASLVSLAAVLDGRPTADVVGVTAGHSVGEFSAAVVAGVLDGAGAVALVTSRALFMAEAARIVATGMSAVVGGDPEDVLAAIAAAGLHPANVNGGGQLVAAGYLDGLAHLAAHPPAKARVIPLAVAGAFHTPAMQPAVDRFAPVAASWASRDPQLTLVSNLDGRAYADLPGAAAPYGSGSEVLRRLAAQIVAPVRWDLCQRTLVALGVTGLLELAPAGVLTGLARRTLPGVETVAVRTPADLDAARDLVRRHAGPRDGGTPMTEENPS